MLGRDAAAASAPSRVDDAAGCRWRCWASLVLAQICYPLTAGATRAGLTVATVVLGCLLSVGARRCSPGARGPRPRWSRSTTGGGLAVEALGVATGFPFGGYDYSGSSGPKLLGVPLVIPLAWTWMAWPAWLAAGPAGCRPAPARIAVAAVGLAAWDLFLDPQMVAEGYWRWLTRPRRCPACPASRSATTSAGCSSRC